MTTRPWNEPPGAPPNRLADTLPAERPQERLERLGPAALSDTELVALLLRSGTPGQDVLTLAARLVSDAGSLAGLMAWQEPDFRRYHGIGRVKSVQWMAVLEIARRVVCQQINEAPVLSRADLVFSHLQAAAANLEGEKFWVLCLNRRHRLIKQVEITSGTATAALAHPREVFRAAIRESASAITCVHNHPSGDPSPSSADFRVTHLLRDAATTVEIALVDHIIIGRPQADPMGRGYYSFREAGGV